MFLVRSGAIGGYEQLGKRLGGNPNTLLAEVGLTSAQLRSPNTYISYSKMAELLELSARQLGCPCFGLLMCQRQNSSVLGDVNTAVFQQSTVREAIEAANRNLYLHARGVHLELETRGGTCQVSMVIAVHTALGLEQTIQMSVGQLANFLRDLLQLKEPAFPILLQQGQPGVGCEAVDQSLFSRLRFGSAVDGIRFDSRWLDHKPKFDEESLRLHLQGYLASLQERYPNDLRDQVKEIIGQLLPTGECALEKIASTLDLHPRVLQQRLQGIGCNYGELLRETRQELAEQHLRYRYLSVTDLALKLGYSETSIFSRSFKQWTGYSPRQWQQRHLK